MKHIQSMNELFGFGKKKSEMEKEIKKMLDGKSGKIKEFYFYHGYGGEGEIDDDGIIKTWCSFYYTLSLLNSIPISVVIEEFDDANYYTIYQTKTYDIRISKITKCENVSDVVKYINLLIDKKIYIYNNRKVKDKPPRNLDTREYDRELNEFEDDDLSIRNKLGISDEEVRARASEISKRSINNDIENWKSAQKDLIRKKRIIRRNRAEV